VVAARDTVLERDVAIKEMLSGADSVETLKRFLREGEVAGRLSHPNVIPVHDIGVREDGGEKTPYFVMTRIEGRDLKEIIKAVEKGEGRDRHDFSRPRLLRVFQLAMAYSHDHGVIHRDLKPANVMVGKYGETYVVDWGLAKVIGQKDDPAATIVASAPDSKEATDSQAPALTMEGQILGTPAYMPPEQADGNIDEIDHQSDVYSLGAILYEILTFRPPFEGATGFNVIAKVLTGDLTPPSVRASEIRKAMQETRKSDVGAGLALPRTWARQAAPLPESVPPELDEIVLKAMARDKAGRYASVMELNEEVQRFLEGEKQREYNHQMAMAKIETGGILVEKMGKMRSDLEFARKEAEEKGKDIKPHWPVEKKEEFWSVQEKVKTLRRRLVETFTEVGNSFQEALTFERRNPDARASLADLYWDQYMREEESGDEAEMIRYEGLVRTYNDGQYDAKLEGDGTLTIATQHYPCRCLTEGRMVSPEELAGGVECGVSSVERKEMQDPSRNTEHSTLDTSTCGMMGYHPFSGRALDGHKGAEGLPELDPKEPVRLKIHSTDCRTEILEGADVWLFKYEERRKIQLPVFPEGIEVEGAARQAIPDSILDRCFDPGSPYRPAEGLNLGKTPVAKFNVPMGSYLLIIHREGFHLVRCPVYIERLADEEMNVTLYRDGEIPEGFIQIPAGHFIYQGDKDNPYSGPKEIKETEDAFIAKYPVTCREYLEFLNDTAGKKPEETANRVPRKAPTAGLYWPKDEEGMYHIPTEKWVSDAPEALGEQALKLENSPIWWNEDWPVFSISWEDLMAYGAWKSMKEGLLFSLPHEIPWEKSARGTDGRFYPWGKEFDATFCNSNQSHEEGMRPTPVDSFPSDESPYGVRGLGGNCRDNVLNDPGEAYPGWRLCRGGSWADSGIHVRSANRAGDTTSNVVHSTGGRLSWLPGCRAP
jgi:serine/threonine protein kinase/formylglycine-generating enzyme required for sulfatase activity